MKRIFVIIFILLSICGYSQIDTLNCDTDTIWENITLKINSNMDILNTETDTAQSTADSAQTAINSAVLFTTYLYTKVQVDSLDSINALDHNNYDSVYVYNYFNARIDSLRNRVKVLEDSIVTYNNHFTWIYGQLNALWDSIGSTAPDLTAAICDSAHTVNDTMIYLFFSENLDPDSVPNVDSFYVTENGARFGVQTVTISNDTVRMEMDSTIATNSVLLVDYLGNKLTDLAGNKTTNFTDTTITNNNSTLVVTDNFNSYTNGTALAGQGSWLSALGTITCTGTEIYPNSTGEQLLYWNTTFSNNQYAEIISNNASSSRFIGVACRVSGTSGYVLRNGNSTLVLGKVINGTFTQLGIHSSLTGAQTIKLTVVGSTLTVYLNGIIDTGMNNGTGIYTDTDLTSGAVGLSGLNATSTLRADNFEGGNQ